MDGIAQLALTLAVGTVASFAVFKLSVLLYERVKSPLLNPLLVTVAFIIAALVALRIPLDSYEQSVQLISFLLGPATVALAYSVYRQRQTLKEHFVPIFAGCLVGSVVSMASAYALCKLLGLDDALALSFIPKSVTTPIAIAVSQQLGGITSITVAAVMPGDIKTGFTAARQKNIIGDDIYGGRISRSVAGMEKDEQTGMDPAAAGRFIANVALKNSRKPLYTIGFAYKGAVFLTKILPARWLNGLIGMIYAK